MAKCPVRSRVPRKTRKQGRANWARQKGQRIGLETNLENPPEKPSPRGGKDDKGRRKTVRWEQAKESEGDPDQQTAGGMAAPEP
jgi:hypothetical protein